MYFNTLDICLRWISDIYDMDSILSVPLLRVLSRLNVSNFIEEGYEVVGNFSLTINFCTSCSGFTSARFSWRSMILFPGCWYPPTNISAVSLGSWLCQKVSYFIGDPKFLEGMLRACDWCPGKSSTRLLVSLFSDKEGIFVSSPWYLTVLLWRTFFLFIL